MNFVKLALQQQVVYFFIAILLLFLAYSEALKNLSIALMFFYLLYQLVHKDAVITKDAINISLIAHLLVVFAGIWLGINSSESVSQSGDVVKIVLVFLFFREAKLDFISLETIIKLLVIGFIVAILVAMINYYMHNYDFLKLKSVGSINRSAVYIAYIFVTTLVLRKYFLSKYTQLLLFFGLVLSGASLILGGSRMAMLTMPLIVLFHILLQKQYKLKEPFIIIIIMIFIAIIAAILFLYPDARIAHKFSQGLHDPARVQIWLTLIYAWLEHNIFFGIGVGNSIFIDVNNYFDNALTSNIDNAHHVYLDMLSERGVLGFTTFFTFIGSLFVFNINQEYRVLIRLLIFALCLMGLMNITFRYEFALLFVIIIGALLNPSIQKQH